MAWLSQNWFWVLIGIIFIGMHLFRHGGHGGGDGGHGDKCSEDGHGGHPRGKSAEIDDPHKAFEKDGKTSQSETHQHSGDRSC